MKSKIEWCDYTINPVKGLCPMACSYCYARRLYKRFKWNPEIRFDDRWIPDLANIKKPSRIFVGSTMELFGNWVSYWWLKTVFDYCVLYPQHTFIFLTKQPQNLIKWSPFPDNCWVGVSATNRRSLLKSLLWLRDIEATIKFLSCEPLLDQLSDDYFHNGVPVEGINWVIIGAQTPYSKKTAPRIEWVKEIVDAADKANIPVFLKNNLNPLFLNINNKVPNILESWWGKGNCFGVNLRQELPQEAK